MNNLFVYCEIEEGNVLDVSLELLTKGRSLANQLNCQLEAVVAGTGLKDIEKQILPYWQDKLHVFDGEGLYPYTSLPHTAILVNLFKEEQPQICLMGATVIGRDLGPRVSSALTSGLTADCTSLEIGDHVPFITEELWQQLREREPGASLMVTLMKEPLEVNEKFLQEFELAKEIISNVRSIRLQKNIALKEQLELQVVGSHPVEKMNPVIIKMCNLSAINVVFKKAEGAASFMVGTTEFAVPLIDMIDIDAEITRLLAELKHKESFLQGIVKKLSNEKFVNNAPAAVIELERKKQADAESIIRSLKESLTILLKK